MLEGATSINKWTLQQNSSQSHTGRQSTLWLAHLRPRKECCSLSQTCAPQQPRFKSENLKKNVKYVFSNTVSIHRRCDQWSAVAVRATPAWSPASADLRCRSLWRLHWWIKTADAVLLCYVASWLYDVAKTIIRGYWFLCLLSTK